MKRVERVHTVHTKYINRAYHYCKVMSSVCYLNLFSVSLVIGDSEATIIDIVSTFGRNVKVSY
jgi:hypothetical protein